MIAIKKNKPYSKESATELTCLNCETKFKGNYCPECGQAVKDYNQPVSFIFYNFVGDFFSFDTRFLKTFQYLLFRPGFLTKEFLDGRRVRYAPPIRIFIFISFLLFLLLQIYTDRGIHRAMGYPLAKDTLTRETDSLRTDLLIHGKEMSQLKSGLENDTNLNFNLSLESFSKSGNLRETLNSYAENLERKLEDIDSQESKQKMIKLIQIFRSPEQVVTRILKYLSWTFFFLLPVFALILKLFYFRQDHFYMRHLVFSIHFHSFVFILFTLMILLYWIFDRSIPFFNAILIFTIPVYFILALKKYYGQNYPKVILKSIGITFIYNLIACAIVLVVIIKALDIT